MQKSRLQSEGRLTDALPQPCRQMAPKACRWDLIDPQAQTGTSPFASAEAKQAFHRLLQARGVTIDGKTKAWQGIDGHGALLSFIGGASLNLG
jgi:hypothetical protein